MFFMETYYWKRQMYIMFLTTQIFRNLLVDFFPNFFFCDDETGSSLYIKI